MKLFFAWLDRHRDGGVLLLRAFIGVRLLYGVSDNVFSWRQMVEFCHFLHRFHFPFPLASAVASVYAQLVAGILFMLGYRIRYAALLMVVNFLIALATVHSKDGFEAATPALAMLFGSLLFLFQGAGKYSLDGRQ